MCAQISTAVGVVLYELLCGRTPFEEEDGFALITTHISHDPPCILQFNPILSPALVTVVMRAIRRDPAEALYVYAGHALRPAASGHCDCGRL